LIGGEAWIIAIGENSNFGSRKTKGRAEGGNVAAVDVAARGNDDRFACSSDAGSVQCIEVQKLCY
jgi:hypothetical protein